MERAVHPDPQGVDHELAWLGWQPLGQILVQEKP